MCRAWVLGCRPVLPSHLYIFSAGLLSLGFEGRLGIWGCPRNGADMFTLKMHVFADALSLPLGALGVVWGSFIQLHGLASS